jgi:hypothetical protein
LRIRPWGPVDWALSLGPAQQWHVVGTLGTEQRSLCVWQHLHTSGRLASAQILEVEDPPSSRFSEATAVAIGERWQEFLAAGGKSASVSKLHLMAELFRVREIARTAAAAESVVLDITSLPKRVFFVLLSELVATDTVKNLIVTYTAPDRYSDGPLYEDVESWRVLPGFGAGDPNPTTWIVSVGFLVETLRQHMDLQPEKKVSVLIPFPAPLDVLRRTWTSVARLEGGHIIGRYDEYRVDPTDVSAAYDRLCAVGRDALPGSIALAPFGPKPTSAAMCLYAMQTNSSVHYAQPTAYNPAYSSGIRHGDPSRAITAYWIKHAGEKLYQV